MVSSKDKTYLWSFMEISKSFGLTLAVDEVLDQIVRQITAVMGLKETIIRLIDPRTNTMELVAAQGLSEKYLKKGRVATWMRASTRGPEAAAEE